MITSPGSFYGESKLSLTYDLSRYPSKRRNNLICSIFIYAKAMEAKGTGFEKIQSDYKNANENHKPYIYEKNNEFSIVLPDLIDEEGVPIAFDSIEINKDYEAMSRYDYEILSFCYSKKQSVKDISLKLGVSNSSYFRNTILENLVKENLLSKVKEGNTTYYLTNKELVTLR